MRDANGERTFVDQSNRGAYEAHEGIGRGYCLLGNVMDKGVGLLCREKCGSETTSDRSSISQKRRICATREEVGLGGVVVHRECENRQRGKGITMCRRGAGCKRRTDVRQPIKPRRLRSA